MDEVLFALVVVVALGVPVLLTGRLVKRVARRLDDARLHLESSGSVHEFRTPLVLGTVLFGGGAVLLGAGLLPLLVWLGDGDPEGRRVFLGLVVVFAVFAVPGLALGRLATRLWVVEPDALCLARARLTGSDPVVGGGRRLPLGPGTVAREVRSLTGAVEVVGPDGTRIRVPRQVDGFDLLADRLRRSGIAVEPLVAPFGQTSRFDPPSTPREEPGSTRAQRGAPAMDARMGRGDATPQEPWRGVTHWQVSDTRRRVTLAFLGLLLAGMVGTPLVLGPTWGDRLGLAAIFGVVWLGIALLVGQESFQVDQPVQIAVDGEHLRWRTLQSRLRPVPGPWRQRRCAEVTSASVATDIIYVKGFPGYRHPVWITFADGERLVVDDFRARHLRTTTHHLSAVLRERCCTLATRLEADREQAHRWLAVAAESRVADDHGAVAGALDRAIAAWPSEGHLARHREAGDAWRRAGEPERAVASYLAHLDHDPDDVAAWEGLAQAHRDRGRDDLAAEATATAERLHLS